MELLSCLTLKCLGCSNLSKALNILPLGIILFTLLSNREQQTGIMTIKPDFLLIPTSYSPVGVQFTFLGWQPWDGDGLGARGRKREEWAEGPAWSRVFIRILEITKKLNFGFFLN